MDIPARRIIVLDMYGATWSFGVCDNTWRHLHPGQEPPGPTPYLAYDAAGDRTLAFGVYGDATTPVWSYRLAQNTWSPLAALPTPGDHVTDVVYDPDRLLMWTLLTRKGPMPFDSMPLTLWAFDPRTLQWTRFGRIPPPPGWPNASSSPSTLLTYDTRRRALVVTFTAIDHVGLPGRTWRFDPERRSWTQVATSGPMLPVLSWFDTWGEAAFDATADATVATSDGWLETYRTGQPAWSAPPNFHPSVDAFWGTGPMPHLAHTLVFDPVNDRIVVIGGGAFGEEPLTVGPSATGAVWAYVTRRDHWLLLSSPTG